MNFFKRFGLLFLSGFLFSSFVLEAVPKEMNLLPDQGYETELGKVRRLTAHQQEEAVSAEKDTCDFSEGKASLKITVKKNLRIYAAVSHGAKIHGTMPDSVSISYKSNAPGGQLLVRFLTESGGKKNWNYHLFKLPPTPKWKTFSFPLNDVPPDASVIAVEERVTSPGIFQFDDLKFYTGSEKNPSVLILLFEKGSNSCVQGLRYRGLSLPGPMVWNMLSKKQFTIEAAAAFSPGMNLEFLKKFNIVVLGCEGESTLDSQNFSSESSHKLQKMLADYVREGGGLLVMRAPGWQFGTDIKEYNSLLKPFGAEILFEQVVDPAHQFIIPGSGAKVFWTDNLKKHPVTNGVRGFFYPDILNSEYAVSTDFTSPVKTDANWTIPIRGAASASSLRNIKRDKKLQTAAGSFSAAPPLLALREYGKGRIALFPIASTLIWNDSGHAIWGNGILMDGEFGGHPGNGLTLMTNLFDYLAQPSKNVFGGYPPRDMKSKFPGERPTIHWDSKDCGYTGDYLKNCYKGLLGARTSLSGGKGTPEEFIHNAEKAGYDFIVFFEDLSKMDLEKFTRLKDICRKSSNSKISAYPGFRYLDDSGTAWGCFGRNLFYPEKKWFSAKHPGRIATNYPLFHGYGMAPVILLHSNLNPRPSWFAGNFKGFSVFTYQGGKLLDDSLGNYQKMRKYAFRIFPVAVHLVDSPDDVSKAEGGFQTFIRTNGGHDTVDDCLFKNPYSAGKRIDNYPSFVSEGPEIKDFRIFNPFPDLASGSDRCRLHLKVSSDAGITKAVVTDGDDIPPWRCFSAGNRPVFEKEIDFFHDRGRTLMLSVTDAKGRRAISWDTFTGVYENWFPRCTDNFNTMPRGKWYFVPEASLNTRGIENYQSERRFSYIGGPIFQNIGKEGTFPCGVFRPALETRFGYIIDQTVNEHFSAPNSIQYTDSPHDVLPNEFQKHSVRYTYFTGRNTSSLAVLVEGRIEILKAFNAAGPSVFSGTRKSTYYSISETSQNRKTVKIVPGNKITGLLKRNESVAIFPDMNRGALGIIGLSDNLHYEISADKSGNATLALTLDPGKKTFTAGDLYTYRYLWIMGGFSSDPNDRFIQDITEKLGLCGKTAYSVVPEKGEVVDKTFTLKLHSAQKSFSGKVRAAKLPFNLPVLISGLNPNWDAGILYKGENTLLIPEWSVTRYNQLLVNQNAKKFIDELQRIPVLPDGTGFLQVDTEFGDRNVFIGNLLTADNPDIRLTLLDSRPGKQAFEAHNPTDKPITCTVKPGKGFGLLGEFTRKITVPAGSSLRVALQ